MITTDYQIDPVSESLNAKQAAWFASHSKQRGKHRGRHRGAFGSFKGGPSARRMRRTTKANSNT